MNIQILRSMLDRIRAIRHACDLDLLLFFYRHPCALLTSEQIVACLGYERERIVNSIEGLIEAGLLTRSQNPSRSTRLYVLELRGPSGGLLSSFWEIAATREGRQDVMRLLESGHDRAPSAGLQPRASLTKGA
jgi:hypothetical protein